MQAVLYIGHGSRVPESCEQAKSFIKTCTKNINVAIQETCFLELAEPTVAEGVQRCVERGATSIAVVPVLLLSAGHAKKDIPNALASEKERYPDVTFQYGRPFGVDESIVDILVERIHEQEVPISNDAMVLLVGRGSSDPEQIESLQEIAHLLQATHLFQRVDTCFLAAATPSFDEGLEQAQTTGRSQVFIVPYLLFTGILMNSMEEKTQALQLENQDFILCNSLGYHPHLQKVLIKRVKELIL